MSINNSQQSGFWEVASHADNRTRALGDATYTRIGKPVRLNRGVAITPRMVTIHRDRSATRGKPRFV